METPPTVLSTIGRSQTRWTSIIIVSISIIVKGVFMVRQSGKSALRVFCGTSRRGSAIGDTSSAVEVSISMENIGYFLKQIAYIQKQIVQAEEILRLGIPCQLFMSAVNTWSFT